MTLIYDDIDECWLWVDSVNHDLDMSPKFDEREQAENWLATIKERIVNG